MKLFKSYKEKRMEMIEKIKKDWHKTSEHTLGISSYEESIKLQNKVLKATIDANNGNGVLISDSDLINELFSDLTPEQKVLILYYSRYIESLNLKYSKI